MGTKPHRDSKAWNMWRVAGFDVTILDSVVSGGKSTEQTIDDVLHAQILHTTTKKFGDERTLILLTGDGNDNHGRTSFVEDCDTALRSGWRVEVWTWKSSTSKNFIKFSEKYPGDFSIYYLDEYRADILKWEARRPRHDERDEQTDYGKSGGSADCGGSTSSASSSFLSLSHSFSSTSAQSMRDETLSSPDAKRVCELLYQFISDTQPNGKLEAIYMSEFYKKHQFAKDTIRQWKLKPLVESFGKGKMEWLPDDNARGHGWIKLVSGPGGAPSTKLSSSSSSSSSSHSSSINDSLHHTSRDGTTTGSNVGAKFGGVTLLTKDDSGNGNGGGAIDVSKIKKAKSEMTDFMLQCPLSNTRMHNPTLVPCCGMTFEKSAITAYIDAKGACPSPTCKRNLGVFMLMENAAIKKVIDNK